MEKISESSGLNEAYNFMKKYRAAGSPDFNEILEEGKKLSAKYEQFEFVKQFVFLCINQLDKMNSNK